MLGLVWTGIDFQYQNSSGEIIALDPSADQRGPQAFVVDRQAFLNLCATKNLTIIWTVLGEKQIYGGGLSHEDVEWMEIYGAYVLAPDGTVSQISMAHELKNNRRATVAESL
jgi:hypothetical protein